MGVDRLVVKRVKNLTVKHKNWKILTVSRKKRIYSKSFNSMGSIAFLLNGFDPTYLTESSKPLLVELNLNSVM